MCLWGLSLQASGQCTPTPPADPLTCGSSGGSSLANNAAVDSGTSFFHCNTSGSFSGITLNGGTLVICGNVTITSSNLNSGTLIITRSASVTFSSNVLINSNIKLVNYGSLTINGNLEFQNAESYFYNADTDARTTISGTVIFAQNDNQTNYFYNKGYLTAGAFQIRNGVRTFCLESGSTIRTTNFVLDNMNEANSITYGSGMTGTATIRYTNNFTINNNIALTASNRINICRAPAASTISGSGNRGSATLTNGCGDIAAPTAQTASAGCVPLPVELIDFKVEKTNEGVLLVWHTAQEIDFKHFVVEKSWDALNFTPIATLESQGSNSSGVQSYRFLDKESKQAYYRLKKVDNNGEETLTKVISNETGDNEEKLSVSLIPNPASDVVQIQMNKADTWHIEIYSMLGHLKESQILSDENNITLSIKHYERGTYLVKCSNEKEIVIKKLVVN